MWMASTVRGGWAAKISPWADCRCLRLPGLPEITVGTGEPAPPERIERGGCAAAVEERNAGGGGAADACRKHSVNPPWLRHTWGEK